MVLDRMAGRGIRNSSVFRDEWSGGSSERKMALALRGLMFVLFDLVFRYAHEALRANESFDLSSSFPSLPELQVYYDTTSTSITHLYPWTHGLLNHCGSDVAFLSSLSHRPGRARA